MSNASKPARRPPPAMRRVNRFMSRFAGRYVYALLRHTGRRSGKLYTTPVVAWRTAAGIIIPLSWGTTSDWYQNIVASGEADVQLGGRWYHGTAPRLLAPAEALSYLPPATRLLNRLFNPRHYLLLAQAGWRSG